MKNLLVIYTRFGAVIITASIYVVAVSVVFMLVVGNFFMPLLLFRVLLMEAILYIVLKRYYVTTFSKLEAAGFEAQGKKVFKLAALEHGLKNVRLNPGQAEWGKGETYLFTFPQEWKEEKGFVATIRTMIAGKYQKDLIYLGLKINLTFSGQFRADDVLLTMVDLKKNLKDGKIVDIEDALEKQYGKLTLSKARLEELGPDPTLGDSLDRLITAYKRNCMDKEMLYTIFTDLFQFPAYFDNIEKAELDIKKSLQDTGETSLVTFKKELIDQE